MESPIIAYVRAWLETTITSRLDLRDERGLVAVEWAVAIVIALAMIGAFAVIAMTKVRSNTSSIPDQVPPPP